MCSNISSDFRNLRQMVESYFDRLFMKTLVVHCRWIIFALMMRVRVYVLERETSIYFQSVIWRDLFPVCMEYWMRRSIFGPCRYRLIW